MLRGDEVNCCFMLECVDDDVAREAGALFNGQTASTATEVYNVFENCKELSCTQDERFVYGSCVGDPKRIYDALSYWVRFEEGKIALVGVAQRKTVGDPYQLKLLETGDIYGRETDGYLSACLGVFRRYLDLCAASAYTEYQLQGFIDLCWLSINEDKVVKHCSDWLYYIGQAACQPGCDKTVLVANILGGARAQESHSTSFKERICGANLLLRVMVHIIMFEEMKSEEPPEGKARGLNRMSLS